MVVYRPGRASTNLVVPASAASPAGHSLALLVSAVMEHLWLWPITRPTPPVVLSLANVETAADGVFSCTSLFVRVDGTGEFFMGDVFLGAWDSSTFESIVALLCACCW